MIKYTRGRSYGGQDKEIQKRGNVEVTYLDSSEELDRFLSKNPGFSRKMVRVLTNRLAQTDTIVREELSGRSRAAMVGFMWD